MPTTVTAPAHPLSSFIFTCTSEQPTLILHLSSREGSASVMRGLSSIPKVLSPIHGCPSDEPRNKCLLRCCWPRLLQGTPRQPSGTAQMGWRRGLQQALFQGAVAWDSGGFFFFFPYEEKISFPYQTRMTIYRKLCSEFIIWSERKWYSIVIHPN